MLFVLKKTKIIYAEVTVIYKKKDEADECEKQNNK